MYIDTHGLVQSYLLYENKDGKIYEMLNLYQRLNRQVLLAHLACAPRQLFSRKKIKYVQLNKGCSHWGDGGDRRCKLFSCLESSGWLLQPWPVGLRGPPDVLPWAQLCFADGFKVFKYYPALDGQEQVRNGS